MGSQKSRTRFSNKTTATMVSFFITEAMHENYSELRKIKFQANIKKKITYYTTTQK